MQACGGSTSSTLATSYTETGYLRHLLSHSCRDRHWARLTLDTRARGKRRYHQFCKWYVNRNHCCLETRFSIGCRAAPSAHLPLSHPLLLACTHHTLYPWLRPQLVPAERWVRRVNRAGLDSRFPVECCPACPFAGLYHRRQLYRRVDAWHA